MRTATLSGVAAPEPESGSPGDAVLQMKGPELRRQEIKFSIQRQYLRAAEKSEISYIKAWRVMRQMDQASLASKAEMTQPEVSRAERPGQARKMKGETLLRIARALNVRIEDLLG
jgi:DNA-binding Xre family transcriptional regulator